MIIFAAFQTLIISRILGVFFFLASFYRKQILDACSLHKSTQGHDPKCLFFVLFFGTL